MSTVSFASNGAPLTAAEQRVSGLSTLAPGPSNLSHCSQAVRIFEASNSTRREPPVAAEESSLRSREEGRTSSHFNTNSLGPHLAATEQTLDLDLGALAALNNSLLQQLISPDLLIGSRMQCGPPITLAEKTSLSDGEFWVMKLDDESNPVRKQLVRYLREAMAPGFTPLQLGDGASEASESRLLTLCLGKPELLSTMVQTPFMHGQTPLVWAITSIPLRFSRSRCHELPGFPLISALTKVSVRGLEDRTTVVELYDRAAAACCETNNNYLFQHFNIRAHPKPNFPTFHYSILQCKEEDNFRFTTHDFYAEMQRSRCIDFRVLFQGHIISITLLGTVSGWRLSLKVVAQSSTLFSVPFHQYRTLQFVALERSDTIPTKEVCLFKLNTENLGRSSLPLTTSAVPFQNCQRDYIQPDGTLHGYLRFRKARKIF